MKTNQTMTIDFSLGQLQVKHKTAMIELDGFIELVNKYRLKSGLKQIHFRDLMKRDSIQEFITLLGDKCYIPRKGRAKGYLSLELAIRIAIDMSPHFAKEVIQIFIEHKILHLRDISGDNYIELNAMLALKAEEVLGKPAHKGHYINIAKKIKERVSKELGEVDNWNVATSAQLAERTRIEEALTTMLKAGVVHDWDHLKELVDKV